MHRKSFPRSVIEAKHRAGWLATHFDCFVKWMQEHGYLQSTMKIYIQQVARLGEYLKRRGICSIRQLEGPEGQNLLLDYRSYRKARGHQLRNSGLKLYIQALEETGVLRNLTSNTSSLFHKTEQYIIFLKNQKGLNESTVVCHRYWVEKFLRFLGCQECTSCLPSFGIADVDEFISQQGVRLQRGSQQVLAGTLRSFLRFLYQTGELSTDLSYLVTSARSYRLESFPRVLNWDEVQKTIDSLDRSTKVGLQRYAILILLTTYGLRGGEVAKLKLEDIDWRKETIRIVATKTGKTLWLPLMPQVGKAILEYLKRGRPPSKCREIFISTRAPIKSLNIYNIAYVVNRQIQLAGIDPPRKGSHLLRHSYATYLKRRGVPLKGIGDLIGHHHPESTHIYTKTATEQLREVALEVPEGI